ncbi:EFR1 family ferrodoxin [Clostridioides sp. ZZV15-6388]|uniref:EFR1 family ferrodoxin n=1 Tax=Clostridioides sp. ZZV15-6388 TaxID=2811499 RepID=UPI001D12BA6D|nr:EFR1 family ferrodoxin [Clostridioides sp. ZZV15-6388]
MIIYFSGTGNSEYVAKKISKELQDEVLNIFEKIRTRDYSDLISDRPWVIVVPTYAWRIPRIVHEWLMKTELGGNKNIYFVMTCGADIGNAGTYLNKLCEEKGMNYRGCVSVIMPENYIALFSTPSKEEALVTIEQADQKISSTIQCIRTDIAFPESKATFKAKFSSGFVNNIFYPIFVHSKKFYVTDACVSCKKCENVCPLENIHLNDGKPNWGNHCTHCMACICRCPKEAIEYGEHSKGMARYTCPKEM